MGRLNYPESARAQGLAGRLVLAADIAPDGTLLSARIEKGSGQPELDSAALNIVRLAAPYAPFPPALARDYDRLTLVRTWSFSRDGNLSAP
ncbi:energy transducer TonB [Laribacter hongkongensis]|uniref:Energy transducer TonB n=1 Tax=Laribacter hongkongensis TaxID=168471 RepID=A0ABD4SNF4_9NEIS|nr:energy transducer TonB [Laribacter hongkongensis]MCG9100555.1 energy transducer TonB [Laribacter hongkongensis]MCG9102281.1 energy transducer TonB [Laribacter hongkongensis]MCG9111737.1 energy transducer TonB [Laribacter hongkongensis]MCG9117777.1 energy transducer TonB [Laribacter hongkongensis]